MNMTIEYWCLQEEVFITSSFCFWRRKSNLLVEILYPDPKMRDGLAGTRPAGARQPSH